MEQLLKTVLFDERLTNLVGENIYLLRAKDNVSAPYVEYEILSEQGYVYSENDEVETHYSIQIDVYTKGDYTEIVKVIKDIMKENEFRREFGGSLYEDKSRLFHYVLRFNYYKEE